MSALPQSNVNNIEDYLKNKYNFMNEKSPYSKDEFSKQDEKLPISNLIDKKSQDDTLDITIFRDIHQNNQNQQRQDYNLKKYDPISNVEPANSQSQKPKSITSDPKLNKLLLDVENIVQKATGKAINTDQNYDKTDPKFLLGSKVGLGPSNKRNADIENHEIRAYLKNLDSKLNIIAPKKEEKENLKKQDKKPINNKNKLDDNKGDYSFSSSSSENSSSFQKKPMKKEPNSMIYNKKLRETQKSLEKNSSKAFCSPAKSTLTRRSNSRHIFEKIQQPEVPKIKEFVEMEKNLSKNAIRQKSLIEMDCNVFCVNCEEFVIESKIDEHSNFCHKTTNHRVPSVDNHYNSLTSSSIDQNNKPTKIFQLKKINEQLNKITSILLQKIKYFENLSVLSYNEPESIQNILLLLDHFLEQTLTLIHNKDPVTISQISKNFHEIFNNLNDMNSVSPDILQILEKIKQYCKIKYEILDPNHNYYNAISTNKGFNQGSFARFSTMRNVSSLSSFLSDNLSQINGISINRPFNNLNCPSENSNNSEINYNNSKILKKKFFNIAIKMKLNMPKGHSGHQVNLSDLFLECMQLKLQENEWEEFLEHKLNIK